ALLGELRQRSGVRHVVPAFGAQRGAQGGLIVALAQHQRLGGVLLVEAPPMELIRRRVSSVEVQGPTLAVDVERGGLLGDMAELARPILGRGGFPRSGSRWLWLARIWTLLGVHLRLFGGRFLRHAVSSQGSGSGSGSGAV